VSGTYHLTSSVGYQLRIADLVVKVVPLSKDNIGKGVTMQPITINHQYPTRIAQYITYNKIKQNVRLLDAICTGACLAQG
jgi:hypothetical protein